MNLAVAPNPVAATPNRTELSAIVRQQLERHPHFRGRVNALTIDQRGKTLYLAGQLPTFYLKQLVQEVVRRLPGVQFIHNEIDVISPYGISSEP